MVTGTGGEKIRTGDILTMVTIMPIPLLLMTIEAVSVPILADLRKVPLSSMIV
jgi:hypothetical protein